MSKVTYDPCGTQPLLLWDTGWDQDFGDWSLDGDALSDNAQILSAVALCLFTDRRADADLTLPSASDDRRGWFGDVIDLREDLGEDKIGSLIWLFERSALTKETIEGIEDAANDALETLIDQGVAVSKTVNVEVEYESGQVSIEVILFSQDGSVQFDQRFTRLWRQAVPGVAL